MPSQVFYRKWRPKRLDEVIGQESITRTLRQAIVSSRVAHAYLFCGPRGTGKTSTARILAKAVNCLKPEEGEPCNSCTMCQSINEGRALDLVEIDAASHRGIDDIRNLRDKVHFSPGDAKYKVYIVDEVHMLTNEAFNALLKTLEEPPPHAIFVLATTEAHKVPVTVVSRCQRFDFRRIPHEAIVERLKELCKGEKLAVEEEVLWSIARSSSGSLRDAENLLEQLVVSYTPPITMENVRSLFGVQDDEKALELVKYILSGDVQAGLKTINDVASQGRDVRQMQRGVLEFLRSVMLVKSGAAASVAFPKETVSQLQAIAAPVPMEKIVSAVKAFAQPSMRLDASATISMELALVESALKLSTATQDEPQGKTPLRSTAGVVSYPKTENPGGAWARRGTADPAAPEASKISGQTGRSIADAKEANFKRDAPDTAAEGVQTPRQERVFRETKTTHSGPEVKAEPWDLLVNSLRHTKGKKFLGPLMKSCKEHYVEGERLVLKFKYQAHVVNMKEELDDPTSRKLIRDAVEKAFGHPYEVGVTLIEENGGKKVSPATQSHMVRAALRMGATIREEKEHDDEQEPASSGTADAGTNAEDTGRAGD